MSRITLPVGVTPGSAPTINVFEETLNVPSSISWRSVLAGVVVAFAITVTLNLLGMSIGFSTIDPASGDTPSLLSLSIWAAIWHVMTAVLAAFAGGWVASYLSNRVYGRLGSWHGLITWAVSTLLMVYLISAAMGSLVGNTLSAVGGAAKTAAVAAAPVAAHDDPYDQLDNQVRAFSGADARALSDVATSNIRRIIHGQPANADQLRAQAVTAAMRANNMTEPQAQAYVAQLEQDYRAAQAQIEDAARKAAEATAKTISRASLLAVLALVFGALAGWMGGNFASENRLAWKQGVRD